MTTPFRYPCAVGIVLWLLAPPLARAQEEKAAAETPKDPRVAALTTEAELAELRKRIRDASLPSVTPLEGNTTIDDGVKVEVQIIAHRAVAEIAERLASALPLEPDGKCTVVLLDASLGRALLEYRALDAAVGILHRRFEALERLWSPAVGEMRPSLALPAAGAVLQEALGFLSLLRQDTRYFGREVAIGELALRSMLAAHIRRRALVVWPSKVGWGQTASGFVPTQVGPRLDELSDRVADAVRRVGDAAKDQSRAAERQPLVAAYEAWIAAAQELLLATSKVGDGTGPSLLERAQNAAWVLERTKAGGGAVYYLASETVVSGGSYRSRKNLFTTLFTGDLLSYSGGAAVSYVLFDANGNVVSADTLSAFTGFGKFRNKSTRFALESW